MKVGILTTNGGPHPASKWAEQTAAQIADVIVIDPNSLAFEALTAQKQEFENELTVALEDHHELVQSHELGKIEEHGDARLAHDIIPEQEHIDDAVAEVQAVADTKIFGSHFRKPEVVAFLEHTIGSHFATSKHIHRSWHADRNPHTPEAKAFRDLYHPKGE